MRHHEELSMLPSLLPIVAAGAGGLVTAAVIWWKGKR
jgi:hypothetical protein